MQPVALPQLTNNVAPPSHFFAPELVPRSSPASLVSLYSPQLSCVRSVRIAPPLLSSSPLSAPRSYAPPPPLPPLRKLPPALPSFKPLPLAHSAPRARRRASLSPPPPSLSSQFSSASSRMPSPRRAARARRGRRTAPNSNLQCHICLQFYSRRDNLRVHQRVHTGERPFSCRYCSQPFRWQGALKNHESIHVRNGDVPLPDTSRAGASSATSHRNTYALHASAPPPPPPPPPPLYAYAAAQHHATSASMDLRNEAAQPPRAPPPAALPLALAPAPAGAAASSSSTSSLTALEHDAQEARTEVVVTGVESGVAPLYTTYQGAADWAGAVLDDLSPPRERSRE
eukprot:TRINITY_DN54_c0_g1_i1.p1 TRINITY_DN54_c0_g1~~TRINITY_DN54_c0_g1_i1.p1  ORF type:complete len:342 (+),score=96.45 TRINITY_DN54_c0_g1_i1:11369-12394(+)